MSEAGPKRRWFRFSLRTVLVAVMLLAGWLAHQTEKVRARREARDSLVANGAIIHAHPYGNGQMHGATVYPRLRENLPWVLWMLGETPTMVIDSPPIPKNESNYIRQLFPEADVHVGVRGFYSPLNRDHRPATQ